MFEELESNSLVEIDGGSTGSGIATAVAGVATVAGAVAGGSMAAPVLIVCGCFAIGYGIGTAIKG